MAVTAAATRRFEARTGLVLATVFAVATVVAQVVYPRVPAGAALDRLTVAIVVLFFAASVTAAAATRGLRFTLALVAVMTGGGLVVEAIGVATGIPFGSYTYAGTLGPTVAGVPVVIGMAWTMMGYPAYVVGRRIAGEGARGAVAAGAALAAWDLFLDPQMVAAGHWRWAETSTPEFLGIPATNFLGWFLVATVMMLLLQRAPAAPAADDRIAVALYVWTWGSSVLAHAVYLGLPASALAGGVGMGVMVALYLRAVRHRP